MRSVLLLLLLQQVVLPIVLLPLSVHDAGQLIKDGRAESWLFEQKSYAREGNPRVMTSCDGKEERRDMKTKCNVVHWKVVKAPR